MESPGYKPGDKVKTHPATDAFMRGDRYGTVKSVSRRTGNVRVTMDRSGRVRTFHPDNLIPNNN